MKLLRWLERRWRRNEKPASQGWLEGSCLPPPDYWINSIIAELKIFYNVDFTFERKEARNEFID